MSSQQSIGLDREGPFLGQTVVEKDHLHRAHLAHENSANWFGGQNQREKIHKKPPVIPPCAFGKLKNPSP